jgi:uncharacterized membrane protein
VLCLWGSCSNGGRYAYSHESSARISAETTRRIHWSIWYTDVGMVCNCIHFHDHVGVLWYMSAVLSSRAHNVVQDFLYQFSIVWRCHQLSRRSFFIRGRQLPLCSRCAGILVGLLLLPIYWLLATWQVSVLFIIAFLVDTLTQLSGFRESTNWLRFSTGVGFSLATCSLLLRTFLWLLNTKL